MQVTGQIKKFGCILSASAVVLASSALLSIISPSVALAASVVTPGSCGRVLLAGSAWLGGKGVAVRSNGADEGLGADCASGTSKVKGVTAGEEWQCVEMINRLYLSRGWISSPWNGNAGTQFYDDAPAKLSKQANGSVSYLGPGDVVIINVFHGGQAEGGHALVVNDSSRITSGTVDLVSQNSGALSFPRFPGHLFSGDTGRRGRSLDARSAPPGVPAPCR